MLPVFSMFFKNLQCMHGCNMENFPACPTRANKQVPSYHIDSEPCIGPGTETLYHMEQKVENGLTYYSFTISCRVHEHSLYPSYFTSVEIAIDEYSGNFKNGLPELVHVGKLRSNEMYITKMELESTLSEWNKFSSLGIVIYNPLTERYQTVHQLNISIFSCDETHSVENLFLMKAHQRS